MKDWSVIRESYTLKTHHWPNKVCVALGAVLVVVLVLGTLVVPIPVVPVLVKTELTSVLQRDSCASYEFPRPDVPLRCKSTIHDTSRFPKITQLGRIRALTTEVDGLLDHRFPNRRVTATVDYFVSM